jgi:hypothetical protein
MAMAKMQKKTADTDTKAGMGGGRNDPAQKNNPELGELVISPFKAWLDYISGNYVRYYTGLLKINIVALLVDWGLVLLLGLAIAGLLFAMLGAPTFAGILASPAIGIKAALSALAGNIAMLAALAAVIIIGIFAITWLVDTVSFTSVVFTDTEFCGKGFSIGETFGGMKWTVLRYVIVNAAIWLVIALPAIALLIMIVSAMAGAASGVLALLLLAYILLAMLVFGFLTQFWRFGFLLEGKGVIESLKASVAIARKQPLGVFLFDVFWVVGMFVCMIPMLCYSFVAGIPLSMMEKLALGSSSLTMWGMYILASAVNASLAMFLATLYQIFSLPTSYLFWKRIRGS